MTFIVHIVSEESSYLAGNSALLEVEVQEQKFNDWVKVFYQALEASGAKIIAIAGEPV